LKSAKTVLTDLTNSVKFSKNQPIKSANQSIELALTVRSAKFSFFKSFPKLPSVKQTIETTNQQVVFHFL